MTKLYVTEYASLAMPQVGGMLAQVPMEPPLAEQVLDYSAGHAESAAFNAKTTLVRVAPDSIASVVFGTAPVAAVTNARFAAGQTEYRGVPKGQSFKVSAITNT